MYPTGPPIPPSADFRQNPAKGVIDTAHRSKEVCGRVFRYAIATGRAKDDIAADLVGALAPRTTTHNAAIINPVKVGELLKAIDGCDGQPTTAATLSLAPYVFVRPTGLRAAEWTEMNLDGKQPEWRIPAERMKMRETHIIPLSARQLEFCGNWWSSLDGSAMCSLLLVAAAGTWHSVGSDSGPQPLLSADPVIRPANARPCLNEYPGIITSAVNIPGFTFVITRRLRAYIGVARRASQAFPF